jgi:hypothetical protein
VFAIPPVVGAIMVVLATKVEPRRKHLEQIVSTEREAL